MKEWQPKKQMLLNVILQYNFGMQMQVTLEDDNICTLS